MQLTEHFRSIYVPIIAHNLDSYLCQVGHILCDTCVEKLYGGDQCARVKLPPDDSLRHFVANDSDFDFLIDFLINRNALVLLIIDLNGLLVLIGDG